jgi:hypothetical protein
MSKQKYLMWAGNYVGNSLLFWRQGKEGYTTDIDQAHQFELEEALALEARSPKWNQKIALENCQSIATKQIQSENLDWRVVGKEASNV